MGNKPYSVITLRWNQGNPGVDGITWDFDNEGAAKIHLKKTNVANNLQLILLKYEINEETGMRENNCKIIAFKSSDNVVF